MLYALFIVPGDFLNRGNLIVLYAELSRAHIVGASLLAKVFVDLLMKDGSSGSYISKIVTCAVGSEVLLPQNSD